MIFLYVFLQAALLWTFSSATIQEPSLGRSNPACCWLAAAMAQWRPTGSSMSVEEQWATTCRAEFSTTVKFTTPAHNSESEPCGGKKPQKNSPHSSESGIKSVCAQMAGTMWDERGQEEPWSGCGQQQNLCCWRTGSNWYSTFLNHVITQPKFAL